MALMRYSRPVLLPPLGWAQYRRSGEPRSTRDITGRPVLHIPNALSEGGRDTIDIINLCRLLRLRVGASSTASPRTGRRFQRTLKARVLNASNHSGALEGKVKDEA